MRNVAISAGLISEKDHESRLTIINESLAATLYCEREVAKNKIPIGNNYIVCDAGGGTVNVASFVATIPFEESKSFPRCQLTADTGERCGSTYLDERMKELLMRVLFRPNDVSVYHSDEQKEEFGRLGFIDYTDDERKELYIIVAELMKQFNEEGGFKYTFPAPVSYEPIDQTPLVESSDGNDTLSDDEPEDYYSSDSDSDESEEGRGRTPEDDRYIENVTTFRVSHLIAIKKINFLPVSEARYIKDSKSDLGVMLLQVSYETMRNLVFDPVISTTIKLLEKQIDKIMEPVATTFLVGGFGRNPYLQFRIKDKFKVEQDGKVIGYRCGELSGDDMGNLAVMRGALYYGLDEFRQSMQAEIIPSEISSKSPDWTICIGIFHIMCQIFGLLDLLTGFYNKLDFKQDRLLYYCKVLNSKTSEFLHSKNLETIPLKKTLCLGGNMADLERHFCLGFSMLLKSLQKSNRITDMDSIRFCVLLNPFVERQKHCRKRIRRAAVDSSLINANDGVDRLLFINHSDAVVLSYQSTPKAHIDWDSNSYRMLITNGDGFIEMSVHQYALSRDFAYKNLITNIRKITSSVYKFDTLAKLSRNIDSLIATRAVTIHCSSIDSHDRYNKSYFQDLKSCLVEFLETCHLRDKSSIQEFTINQSGCCKVFVSTKQLWELVLKPVLEDFVKSVNDSISDNTLIRSTQYKNIHIVGDLVKTPRETYNVFEQYIVKNLAALWRVDRSVIQITKNSAMDGAALFAAKPESRNERLARGTYAVALEAVRRKPFEATVKEEVRRLAQDGATHDQIYKVESENAFPTSQAVQLFYEETSDQLITTFQNVCVDDAYPFIVKGARFSEKEHLRGGIRKRFYALEECIVYANIYIGMEADDQSGLNLLPKHSLQRRHRFEIYLKSNTKSKAPRPIYFEIHLYTKSDEILFDVQLCPKVACDYLQFRLPDSILVSDVLEDEAVNFQYY
ncbi:hypothetical protein MAM1_0087c04782 [Mucor ambiguus]|uniref:Uncharacterized protein n=1 Tax=Mucor ambiguus TaxID=91626 RepID=A0A0C9MPX6_9FUNG|nr:hypothetical protein MAM1_0087c04782 [Mucor ambiguus]